MLLAFYNLQPGGWHTRHDVALAAAKRAVTAPDVLKAIRKFNLQFYRTAMTAGFTNFAHTLSMLACSREKIKWVARAVALCFTHA